MSSNPRLSSRLALGTIVLALVSPTAHAAVKWVTPTAEELAMTADPKAPGAPAVFLSYEETDGPSGQITVHARIKILSEQGFAASDIEIPYTVRVGVSSNESISGRTIHPDGTVLPYQGTPIESFHEGRDFDRRISKLITLPAVTVGSILEYDYSVDDYDQFPTWFIQQKYFAHSVHFQLKVANVDSYDSVRWSANLPAGVSVVRTKNHFDVTATDLPPATTGDYLPPRDQYLYNVNFFYWPENNASFWAHAGELVHSDWADFLVPRKKFVELASGLVTPSDSDTQKLHKLYEAVMGLENTDFTRARSQTEDRKSGFKEVQNVSDIWARHRGTSNELALLFVALARAVHLSADPMAVASRDHTVFDREVMDLSQLDSVIVLAHTTDGEIYLDPGERYCPYGRLAPWHSNVSGVIFREKNLKFDTTPDEPEAASQIVREAELQLDSTAAVTGTVHMEWFGDAALVARQKYLRTDKLAASAQIEKAQQAMLPTGVLIQLTGITALDDYEKPLAADFKITGTLGITTASRILLPSNLFYSQSTPTFAPATRSMAIAFPQAFTTLDTLHMTLPAGLSLESSTPKQTHAMGTALTYKSTVTPATDALFLDRRFTLLSRDFAPSSYARLRDFFAEVATSDHDQIILHRTPAN